MKNLKSYISAAVVATIMLSAVSCKKDYYTNANVNPNSPKSVPDGTLLSGVQVTAAYSLGGDFSRFTSMFDQQTVGYSRQSQAYEQYIFTNQDPESAWDNFYDDVMANDYQLMKQASKNGDHEYYAIGQIMMAYSLQNMVDCWGSIPYSQAFQGSNNLSPAYDKDVALYDTAMTLCYKAIANLQPSVDATDVISPDPSNAKYDGLGADVMYAGSGAQWIKFAHAILARLYIHQAKHSDPVMCDSAAANAAASFTSNADNAQVMFGNASTNNAPWYQFNQQRTDICFYENWLFGGYVTFADSMIEEQDPRLPLQLDTNQEVTGQWIALNNGDTYFGNPNSPVEFSNYAEMQFIQAEATIRKSGVSASAQTFYSAGIAADMSKLGVSGAAQTTFMAGRQGSILLLTQAQAIMQNAWQESLAMYLNPEVWALWRRCNYTIAPITSAGVPRRFLYPQSELNLNAANVPSATQYLPAVFWDN